MSDSVYIKDFGLGAICVDVPAPGLTVIGNTATLFFSGTEQLDLLTWQLAKLGLEITPHNSGPDYGWGYIWHAVSSDWEGLYETRKEAIEAAFKRATNAIIVLREMPFPVRIGDTYRWNGKGWESVNTDE